MLKHEGNAGEQPIEHSTSHWVRPAKGEIFLLACRKIWGYISGQAVLSPRVAEADTHCRLILVELSRLKILLSNFWFFL